MLFCDSSFLYKGVMTPRGPPSVCQEQVVSSALSSRQLQLVRRAAANDFKLLHSIIFFQAYFSIHWGGLKDNKSKRACALRYSNIKIETTENRSGISDNMTSEAMTEQGSTPFELSMLQIIPYI